jgi:hypothetical protein
MKAIYIYIYNLHQQFKKQFMWIRTIKIHVRQNIYELIVYFLDLLKNIKKIRSHPEFKLTWKITWV